MSTLGLVLSPQQLTTVRAILTHHLPGVPVWVFGSRVAGTANPLSDLDLCLYADQPVPFVALAGLDAAFMESDLPFNVDVMDWHRLEPSFRALLMQQAICLSETPC